MSAAMATADTSPASALVRALLDLDRHRDPGGQGWHRPGGVGQYCGLSKAAFSVAIGRAEDMGLVETRATGRGEWIRASRLARQVLGRTPGIASDPDPADLGDFPSAPIVAELAREPSACPPADGLARRLGIDLAELWAVLEAASRDGLVDLWPDAPLGPSAALTPWSAGRLGLSLSRDGSRWLADGEYDPTDADGEMGARIRIEADLSDPGIEGSFLDSLPDPLALGGDASMMVGEEERRRARAARREIAAELDARKEEDRCRSAIGRKIKFGEIAERMASRIAIDVDLYERSTTPKPHLILGIGLPWPVVIVAGEACPGCRDVKLSFGAYCAICHRSGMDRMLEVNPPEPPDPEPDRPKRKTSKKGCRHKKTVNPS